MTSSLPPEFEELMIAGYVLGDLSPAEAMLFEEILAENPEVTQQVIELQRSLEIVYFPAEVKPPPTLKAKLLAANSPSSNSNQVEETPNFLTKWSQKLSWGKVLSTISVILILGLSITNYWLWQKLQKASLETSESDELVGMLRGIDIDIDQNNPSQANKKNLNNLLIVKEEYILSYNCSKGIANWVGWQTKPENLGDLSGSDDFREDESLPKKCYQVEENDYRGTGYDRGHLMPSGDRTKSKAANSSSFLMLNMIPQHPVNNREVWRELEIYSRQLVNRGFTLHSFAGGNGQIKTINQGKISVPKYLWKVILVENLETGKLKAIAVIMPNSEKVKKTDWTDYLVSVDKLESVTGYDFFAYLNDDFEESIESKVYQ